MGIDTAFFNVEITTSPILMCDKLGNPIGITPASRLYNCYNITFMTNYNKKTPDIFAWGLERVIKIWHSMRLASLPYGELNPDRFEFLNFLVGQHRER
jgi:hypothetical protein